MSPAEKGITPSQQDSVYSKGHLRKKLGELGVKRIPKVEIDALAQRPRVADFILNSGLPPIHIRALIQRLEVVGSALGSLDMPIKERTPEEIRLEGREDLASSRLEIAFIEEEIRKLGPDELLKSKLISYKNEQTGASEKIGISKVMKKESILNPAQEVGARAGNVRTRLFFRLGVMPIDTDNEELKAIYDQAIREGWDLSGKARSKDKRLVNAIFDLYADMQKNSEMQITEPILENVVRKSVRATDQDVHNSYKDQRGVGAKMAAQEY